MRRLINILLFASVALFPGMALHAQQKPTFITVDTSTYNLYLRGDWDRLAESGREALKLGFDYYYLEMRIAYACFMKGKYRQAEKYYRRALSFNSRDPVANEYLYYSYLNAGKYNDAQVRIKSLTSDQKKAMGISDSSFLVSAGVSFAHAFSNAEGISHQIIDGLVAATDGVQKTTLSYNLPGISLSHRIGRHILADHSGGYLAKNEFSYVISGGIPFLSAEQPVTQLDYGLNLRITPAEGWLIRPGFHYYQMTIPLYEAASYGPMSGRDRVSLIDLKLQERVFSLMLKKDLRLIELGLSYAHNNFMGMNTHQAGFHFELYPLYNLDLYLKSDLYYLQHTAGTRTETEFTSTHVLGSKIFKYLWLELSASLPSGMLFYDMRNSTGYNLPERTLQSFSATAIVPIYKPGLKLFAGAYLYRNESLFFPASDLFNINNATAYSTYLITGGLIWTK